MQKIIEYAVLESLFKKYKDGLYFAVTGIPLHNREIDSNNAIANKEKGFELDLVGYHYALGLSLVGTKKDYQTMTSEKTLEPLIHIHAKNLDEFNSKLTRLVKENEFVGIDEKFVSLSEDLYHFLEKRKLRMDIK